MLALRLTRALALLVASLLYAPAIAKEHPKVIYDEALVPKYTLPPILTSNSGELIQTVQQWKSVRRPEILKLFRENVYGSAPILSAQPKFEIEADKTAFNGLAIERKIKIIIRRKSKSKALHLVLYLPSKTRKKFPVFIGLSFHNDGTLDGWPIRTILERGYALATMQYKEIAPDSANEFETGIPSLFPEMQHRGDGFSAIGAWAWGLSRGLDYLETDGSINAQQVVVFGHSRLGKAALWAGASDERFSVVISNDSGEGGAALARRHFGETTKLINDRFPHWFCGNFKKFNENENELPVDQHMLLALIAPRPLYVASADEDLWADPRGEFLSAKEASVVYRLFGLTGLPTDRFPATNSPMVGDIGYHLRKGKHAISEYDWQQYLAFADNKFRLTR